MTALCILFQSQEDSWRVCEGGRRAKGSVFQTDVALLVDRLMDWTRRWRHFVLPNNVSVACYHICTGMFWGIPVCIWRGSLRWMDMLYVCGVQLWSIADYVWMEGDLAHPWLSYSLTMPVNVFIQQIQDVAGRCGHVSVPWLWDQCLSSNFLLDGTIWGVSMYNLLSDYPALCTYVVVQILHCNKVGAVSGAGYRKWRWWLCEKVT